MDFNVWLSCDLNDHKEPGTQFIVSYEAQYSHAGHAVTGVFQFVQKKEHLLLVKQYNIMKSIIHDYSYLTDIVPLKTSEDCK